MTDPDWADAFRHRLRVRYAETDAGRVAHHSSYVAWLEEARTEWMRSRGKSYREIEAEGCFLMVTEMQLSYLSPACYDEVLEISVRERARKRASFEIEYAIHAVEDARSVARGMTRLACTDQEGHLRRLPGGL